MCRGGQISYGRKRRRSIEQPLIAEVTEIFRNLTPAELPLQLSIIVQSPVITADHLLSRENPVPDTVLITGGSEFENIGIVASSKHREHLDLHSHMYLILIVIKLSQSLNGLNCSLRIYRWPFLRGRESGSGSSDFLVNNPNCTHRRLPFSSSPL